VEEIGSENQQASRWQADIPEDDTLRDIIMFV
jgi:hypothetical protein